MFRRRCRITIPTANFLGTTLVAKVCYATLRYATLRYAMQTLSLRRARYATLCYATQTRDYSYGVHAGRIAELVDDSAFIASFGAPILGRCARERAHIRKLRGPARRQQDPNPRPPDFSRAHSLPAEQEIDTSHLAGPARPRERPPHMGMASS